MINMPKDRPQSAALETRATPNTDYFTNRFAELDKLSMLLIIVVFCFGLTVQALVSVHIENVLIVKQIAVGSISIGGMIVLAMLPPQYIQFSVFATLLVSTILMISVLVIGSEIQGAKRWISIFGFSLQPVEVFKVAATSFLAIVLGHACDMGWSRKVYMAIACGVIVPTITLITVQPDYSQSILTLSAMLAVFLLMLGFGPLKNLFITSIPVLFMGLSGYMFIPHVRSRFDAFIDKEPPMYGQRWVAEFTAENVDWFGRLDIDALVAGGQCPVRSGCLWQNLPDVESDFVFIFMLQEFGLLIALTPILLLLFVLLRTIQRVWRSQNPTCRLWMWGIVVLLFAQILINLCTSTDLTPPTGVTLPWISHGGSSLVGVGFAFGWLLFLSRDDIRQVAPPPHRVDDESLKRVG